MDTAQKECSPAAVLPLWQTTSDFQTTELGQDFLDMLDTEVGDTVEIVEDNNRPGNSPGRPRMFPHKLYWEITAISIVPLLEENVYILHVSHVIIVSMYYFIRIHCCC